MSGLVATGAVASAAWARSTAPREGLPWSIGGSVSGLWPGAAATPVNLTFSNPNDDTVTVSSLTVAITSVEAPNAGTSLPCDVSDFAVAQFGGGFPLLIRPGSSSLQSLGFAQSIWPTIRMIDNGQNQDGCIGATVRLGYSASGRDGTGTPPSLSLDLSPPSQTLDDHGKASFRVTVANSGGGSLSHVTVTDRLAPGCARSVGTLAVGASQSWTCTRSDVTTTFTNAATAAATSLAGGSISATASAVVRVTARFVPPPVHFGISLEASPRTQTLTMRVGSRRSAGATVVAVSYPTAHFQIKVRNTGSGELVGLKVADELAPGCNRSLAPIGPGGARTYGCVALAVTKSFTNKAVVSGTGTAGTKVTARDQVSVKVIRVAGRTGTGGAVSGSKRTKTTTSAGVSVTKLETKTGATVVVSIPGLLFATGKYTLPPVAQRSLSRVIDLLTAEYGKGPITVTGYTDSTGTPAFNLVLSKERAESVAGWLEHHGIPTSRIAIAWKGQADPVASNATAAGRARNRRTTITVRTGA